MILVFPIPLSPIIITLASRSWVSLTFISKYYRLRTKEEKKYLLFCIFIILPNNKFIPLTLDSIVVISYFINKNALSQIWLGCTQRSSSYQQEKFWKSTQRKRTITRSNRLQIEQWYRIFGTHQSPPKHCQHRWVSTCYLAVCSHRT